MDNLEEILYKETSRAINKIAAKIGRSKGLSGKELPQIAFYPGYGACMTHHTGECILYDSIDRVKVYEEASHALHLMLNEPLKQRLNSLNGTADGFFTRALMESFAYFSSRLFCEREGSSFQRWKDEVGRLNESAVAKVKGIKNSKNLSSEKIIEYHPELRDIFTQRRIIRYGEKIYRWLDNSKDLNGTFRREVSKLVDKAVIRGRMVAVGRDYSSTLYHCLGYDLGEKLHRDYLENHDLLNVEKIIGLGEDALGLFHGIHLDLLRR